VPRGTIGSNPIASATPSQFRYIFINLKFLIMKKLVLLMAVLFGMSLVSCGNAEKTAVTNDSDSTTVDTVMVDTVAVDSVK